MAGGFPVAVGHRPAQSSEADLIRKPPSLRIRKPKGPRLRRDPLNLSAPLARTHGAADRPESHTAMTTFVSTQPDSERRTAPITTPRVILVMLMGLIPAAQKAGKSNR